MVIRQRKRAWNLEDKLRRGEGSKIAQACSYERSWVEREEGTRGTRCGKRRRRKREIKMVGGEQRMERNRRRNEVETR